MPAAKAPDADADEHVAELAHRRVGEDPLDVVLGAADGRREEGGEHADQRDDEHGRRGHDVEEIEPRDHVDPGRDHRGRVDQRADGRRAFHGVGEPDIEGKLRRFSRGADEEEEGDQRRRGAGQEMGVLLQLAEVEGPDAVGAEGRERGRKCREESRSRLSC